MSAPSRSATAVLTNWKSILPLLIVMVLAAVPSANAQNSNDRGTTADSKKGQSSQSTYARDKIETVNLANGNLSLSIPLATIGGRGSASFTLALSYNSKVWSTQSDGNGVSNQGGAQGNFRNIYTAMYDKQDPEDYEPYLLNFGSGWSLLTAPGIKLRTIGIDPLRTGCNVQTDGQPDCGFKYALTKMWVTLPDGSQLELRDVNTQGTPYVTTADYIAGFHDLRDQDRGRIWRSVDGSNVIFVRDAGYSVGQIGGHNEYPSGWVFLPDGTRLRMVQGVGSKIIDRNGNFITLSGGTYTDQLGRQTVITGQPLTVTVLGYMGTPARSLTIDFGTIGDLANLRADFQSLPRPFTTGDAFSDALDNFFEHTIQSPHTDLFLRSEGIVQYGTAEGFDVGTKTAVTRLNLLDGRSVQFHYNQYGEVAEIVYPSGGVSQIDYTTRGSGNCEIPAPFSVNRVVTARRTLKDNGSTDATWVYSPDSETIGGVARPGVAVSAYQGDTNGPLLSSERHIFRALNAEYRNCGGPYTGTGNEKWENAKEMRTEVSTGTGTTVTVRDWQQRAPLAWPTNSDYYIHRGQDQARNDERVNWEETTLENGKVKRVEYGYDQFNNVTSIKEYDFGTAGFPGTLLRQTLRTYLTVQNSYCYSNLNPTDSSCGSGLASDVSTIIYQPGVLLSETVKDGGGAQKARTDFEYDNYTTAANHAAVAINSGMIQYDGTQFSAFASGAQPRGNATKVTRWLSGGTDVVSYSQYDNAGNVVWSKDPGGNLSTLSYADNFGAGGAPDSGSGGPNGATFTFASVATNAANQVVKMQYNYALGAVTGVKDPNNVVTKTEYDNLGRPFRVTAALGLAEQSISEMSYPTATVNEAKTSKQLDATRWLSSKTEFDGFDRPVLAATAEDGLHYNNGASYTIFSKTVYDPLGRAKLAANPYRTTSAVTDGWSRSSLDLAGRLKEIAQFTGSVASLPPDSGTNSNWLGSVTTVYASEVTTVTDQAGKKRRSVMDGLGRLVRVDEPDANGNLDVNGVPAQSTVYSYDTLDNLITVTQGAQTRSFVYDSLKRLISATNPESGTTSQSGTVTYQYDPNGNLTQKTDARGVIATYAYDVLNRNTSVTYSNDPATTPTITLTYDGATKGVGKLWKTETSGATGSRTTISSYDALGRPTSQSQQFYSGGVWSSAFTATATYGISGQLITLTYPSGHTASYVYDGAGRTTSFAGTIGDGTQRTYSSELIYSAPGAITKEKFGTDTPIFNKLLYNSRGQLAEIRESTSYTGPTDTTWDRGAIINHYSNQGGCWGASCNATDNNGNLRRQEVYIPNSDNFAQFYEYDSLNRLQSVRENKNGGAINWQQTYVYDRYGNRTINTGGTETFGGVNNLGFELNAAKNRLYAPGDLAITDEAQRRMQYDTAGNLKRDTYTGAGDRNYDAENRMTKAWGGNNQWQEYTYNANGQRVRRKVDGVETWQVYGIGGELLAEYAANANPASPQKEYGYRNGQLLITAEPSNRSNVASAANGGTATAQNFTADSVYPGQHFQPSYANDGTRYTSPGGDHYWRDEHGLSSWLQLDFNGSKSIDEVDVYTMRDDYATQADPGSTQTFANYGVTSFTVQYWNGSAWTAVSGGTVSGNNLVWKKLTFTAVTTSKIRVVANAAVDGVARIAEVEAWGTAAASTATNVAATANGGTATAQNYTADSMYPGSHFQPGYANDGTRYTTTIGDHYWRDEHGLSSWLQIDFNGSKTINEIDVYTMRDDYATQADPSATQTFANYGVTAFTVQYWNGSAWTAVTGGTITGNNLVWKKINFTSITTSKIRVVANTAVDGVARIVEVEAWTPGTAAPTSNINWLVTDQLGTPRMIFDKTGALATTKRHDYLPFGEEIFAGTGGRTSGQGYSAADGVRQKFTSKERDNETNLDYFIARYYSSTQGRFTSPDEFTGGPRELFAFADSAAANPTFYSDLTNPQSLNKYQYTYNNPLRYIDPDGHDVISYQLLKSGPNQVPDTDRREVNDVSQLGYKDEPKGGYALFNLQVNFDKGDNVDDYQHVRAAVVLGTSYGGEGTVKNSGDENPSGSQQNVKGQSRFVSDNPGVTMTPGDPKAKLNGSGYGAVFVAGEYNKKTGQLSQTVAYYEVQLVYGKDGKIDRSKSAVTEITRDRFIQAAKVAGASIPKDKKKNVCPECLLSPPNARR